MNNRTSKIIKGYTLKILALIAISVLDIMLIVYLNSLISGVKIVIGYIFVTVVCVLIIAYLGSKTFKKMKKSIAGIADGDKEEFEYIFLQNGVCLLFILFSIILCLIPGIITNILAFFILIIGKVYANGVVNEMHDASSNVNKRSGRQWTDEEEKEICMEYDQGVSLTKMVIKHKRSRNAIKTRLKKFNKEF